MSSPAASRLLDAVCVRDFEAATRCLADDAQLRALLPSRFLEANGPDEIVEWLRRWFADATTFTVIERATDAVADRDRLTWRLRVTPHPGTGEPARHIIEQTMFCDVRDDLITRLDLLCSGFRPSDIVPLPLGLPVPQSRRGS